MFKHCGTNESSLNSHKLPYPVNHHGRSQKFGSTNAHMAPFSSFRISTNYSYVIKSHSKGIGSCTKIMRLTFIKFKR